MTIVGAESTRSMIQQRTSNGTEMKLRDFDSDVGIILLNI